MWSVTCKKNNKQTGKRICMEWLLRRDSMTTLTPDCFKFNGVCEAFVVRIINIITEALTANFLSCSYSGTSLIRNN